MIPASGANEDGIHPNCHIVFLCEDWGSQQRAYRLQRVLAENCAGRVTIKASFFFFANLCHPELREKARYEAGGADLFIVSTTDAKGLQPFVRNWLNEFQPPSKPMACAYFFQAGSPNDMARKFMEQWSKEKGLEFVPETSATDRDEANHTIPRRTKSQN